MSTLSDVWLRKRFPVLLDWEERRDGDFPRSVPWNFIEPHRECAEHNHCGQTLERLAERGGLSPKELFCAVRGRRLSGAEGIASVTDEDLQALAREIEAADHE